MSALGSDTSARPATEDGYEIADGDAVMWLSDELLAETDRLDAQARADAEMDDLEEELDEVGRQPLDDALQARSLVAPLPPPSDEQRRWVKAMGDVEDAVSLDAAATAEVYRESIISMGDVTVCFRCRRPGTSGRCSFPCNFCMRCTKEIGPGQPRVFTTEPWVYCMDCGKNV